MSQRSKRDTTTVGRALVTIDAASVTSAWRSANHHAGSAIAARKRGDDRGAWLHTSHAAFYRDVARSYITGTVHA